MNGNTKINKLKISTKKTKAINKEIKVTIQVLALFAITIFQVKYGEYKKASQN